MLNKSALSAVIMSLFAAAVSAEINFDNGKAADFKKEIGRFKVALPSPGPADAYAGAPAEKEWTVMVFINAKNNLESYGLLDVNEMEQVGSGDKLNVVVQMGRISGHDSSDGDWTTVRRYLVQKDADASKITSPVVEEIARVDMGDYRSVIDFGNWAKAKYPARKYMLVIWNHGSGWIKSAGGRGISYDDETGSHINTPQMGEILKAIGGVDVYGSDACLMQMAEVVYEIKDGARFIVGSEETEPGDGYTYDLLLGPLAAKPSMTPEELAKVAVDGYSDHYQSAKQGSTQSYVRSAAIPGFTKAADAFIAAVMASGEKDLAKKAADAAQSYAYAENKDLYHFVGLILAETGNEEVRTKGAALQAYITRELVGHNRTNNAPDNDYWSPPGYDDSYGIAVYLPGYSAGAAYAELAWAKASGWDEFIDWLNK